MSVKIILAGEGGQGIQTIAKILAKAAQKSGKNVSYLPSFGVEQRGGVSLGFIQIGNDTIAYPRFSQADILVAFCNRAVDAIKPYINDKTLLIYDSSEIDCKRIDSIKDKVKNFIAIPAKKIAQEKFTSKMANMILLGALTNQMKDISYHEFADGIAVELQSKIAKDPKIKDLNLGALQTGADFAAQYDASAHQLEGAPEKEIERNFQKESIKWSRFPEYCKGCALCITRCPMHALQFSGDNNFLGTPMPIVDMEKCTGCGTCQRICPDGAIKVENGKE